MLDRVETVRQATGLLPEKEISRTVSEPPIPSQKDTEPMRKFYYQFILFLSRVFGAGILPVFIWPVTTAFFILYPRRVAVGINFYRALFPGRGRLYHLWCTWRQYHNFSKLFTDRFWFHREGDISYTSEGWEHLQKAVAAKSGGIILMSHMGNWETAAGLLKQRNADMQLMLYMGKKHEEKIGTYIKDGLARGGIKIVGVDPEGGSPLDLIEGIHFIRDGGLLSLTGDRPWSGKERMVTVHFLGHQARVLEAPHMIALLSGAPIFILFAFRISQKKYHISVTEPFYVRAASRDNRRQAIRVSAQQYADRMEQVLRRYPLEWFNFEPFLGSKLSD